MEDETEMGECWDLCVESMFRGVVRATGRLAAAVTQFK